MLNLNKKGMAPATIGELILVIAAGIIIIWIVLAIVGFISPTASSIGCGLNVRVRSATLDVSNGWLGSPVLMCNQYNTPVDINAANFKACPGISDFCQKTKSDAVKLSCWQQCARIQVDQLTDSCWTMAGSGRLNLKDSIVSGLTQTFTNPWDIAGIIGGYMFFYSAASLTGLPGASIWGGAGAAAIGFSYAVDSNAKILRCYRYRIVNPIVYKGQTIKYEDGLWGRSWGYNISDAKTCTPSEANPICSLGGEGVKYINEDYGNVTYKINNVEITTITSADDARPGRFMNYSITDPRNQVCYIAYYQGKESGDKYVTRNCYAWGAYTGGASYVN